jgi:RNA polymerase sigma-70 factor, ECF subfamily
VNATTDLHEAWQCGRTRWPGVPLELAAFSAYLSGGERNLALAAEMYLACACLLHVPEAVQAFRQEYLGAVGEYLGTLATSKDVVEEVRQQMMVKLLMPQRDRPPRLADWTGRGSLEGWLRMAAVRIAIDLRRESSRLAEDDPSASIITADDIDAALLKRRYGDDFRAAFREALASLPAEAKAVLRLHYLEGVTSAQLAALFNVSRPTAVRRTAEAKRHVFEETTRRLSAKVGLSGPEVESLITVMRSQLHVSVARLLSSGD